MGLLHSAVLVELCRRVIFFDQTSSLFGQFADSQFLALGLEIIASSPHSCLGAQRPPADGLSR